MKLFYLFLVLFVISNVNGINYSMVMLKVIEKYTDEVFGSAANETKCIKQLKILSSDLKKGKLWGIRMLDASGKPQYGLLEGNIFFVGSFDECLNINVNNIVNKTVIEGKYCRATVSPNNLTTSCVRERLKNRDVISLGKIDLDEIEMFVQPKWDFCFPAACIAADLQKLWDFAEHRYEIQFRLIFDDYYCTSIEQQNRFTLIQIVAISVFSVIGLLVILSTLYDILIFQRKKEKTRVNLLVMFSYYTNGKLLFSKPKEQEDRLSCLDGIKVISLIWIILAHRFFYNFLGMDVNATYIFEWLKHHENMFIVGASTLVDTFFIVSGVLISYIFLQVVEKGIKIPLFTYITHRLLRLSPPLGALLLFYLGIIGLLGSGPYWFYVDEYLTKPCETDWWSIPLYVQNYVHPRSRCIIQSWYVAVDTQLYFLFPIILMALKKWPHKCIACITGLILMSTGYTIYLTYYYEFESKTWTALENFLENVYVPTHTRVTPWLAGVILGYVLFRYKSKKVVLRREIVVLLWIIALILGLLVLYGYMAIVIYNFTRMTVATFVGISRIFWSISVCWVIFACSKGYGGFINTFLSLPIFTILARLSYSMYLTHLIVLSVIIGRTRITLYLENFAVFHGFLGDLACAIGVAVIWTLTFESPVIMIEKILLAKHLNNK